MVDSSWFMLAEIWLKYLSKMIFETERLFVRHWQQSDLHGLFELYSDTAIKEYIRPALTLGETKKIFEEQLTQYAVDEQLGRFIIIDKLSTSYIGIFMLRQPADLEGIEMGYSLRKQDWGKGFATEIVKKGIDYVFDSNKYYTIYAFTHLQNTGSKKVLIKCGFTQLENVIEDGKPSTLFALERNRKATQQFSSNQESSFPV